MSYKKNLSTNLYIYQYIFLFNIFIKKCCNHKTPSKQKLTSRKQFCLREALPGISWTDFLCRNWNYAVRSYCLQPAELPLSVAGYSAAYTLCLPFPYTMMRPGRTLALSGPSALQPRFAGLPLPPRHGLRNSSPQSRKSRRSKKS
jgi:hypothetical protein